MKKSYNEMAKERNNGNVIFIKAKAQESEAIKKMIKK